MRQLGEKEIAWKRAGTDVYRQLAAEAHEKLVACDPLTAVEPDRKRVQAPKHDPLYLERRRLETEPTSGD